MGTPYNMTTVQLCMTNMWEVTKNVFMMICITNKTDEQKNKELGVVQNNFICDTATGNIREAKFSFGDLHELVMDQTYLGNHSMFRTFEFKDGKALTTPVYYIDNKTEQIVAQ